MAYDDKIIFGQRLRTLTDKMNLPCTPFNNIDVINGIDRCRRWDKYSEMFRSQRIAYLRSHNLGEKVFVHGDLCSDNILVSHGGKIYLIDFADAVLAPKVYEYALVAVELFKLDKALLRGYFGNYTKEELAEICFNGLLMHEYGSDIINFQIDKFENIRNLNKFKLKLLKVI
ncbi:MAG: aminoglycoside phosphotransferase family protein [Treponema sp.]|nr:aminoglycoside phosphotransferase family protein [Treponema sp.]